MSFWVMLDDSINADELLAGAGAAALAAFFAELVSYQAATRFRMRIEWLVPAGPFLSHATIRAIRVRETGDWRLRKGPAGGRRSDDRGRQHALYRPRRPDGRPADNRPGPGGRGCHRRGAHPGARPPGARAERLRVLLAVLFLVFQAPDVTLSELAVGAVALPIILLLTLAKIRKREE
jgi:hypothetical protein